MMGKNTLKATSLNLENCIHDILDSNPDDRRRDAVIGFSREKRPIEAFRLGDGLLRISLRGGCHADEPVGPRLLRHLVAYLQSLSAANPLLTNFTWWIIPHANPDGEAQNQSWHTDTDDEYDCLTYLKYVIREPPGEDVEFAFPTDRNDNRTRPENIAIYNWWQSAPHPFHLHASLHGMAVGAGPWFLVEKDWWPRCNQIKILCSSKVRELGYDLHDVERHGGKGFYRLDKGFCSRPDSRAMRRYFIEQNDFDMAKKIRPSSMETIRSFGGDPLTLVSEMPLFIVPSESSDHTTIHEWKKKIHEWRQHKPGNSPDWAKNINVKPFPIKDQMTLQWTFIAAGVKALLNNPD